LNPEAASHWMTVIKPVFHSARGEWSLTRCSRNWVPTPPTSRWKSPPSHSVASTWLRFRRAV